MLEILGKIGFDWQVALANLVNFLIIFFILKKFAFTPLKKVIEDRQNKIAKGLADAEKAATDVMMAEEIRTKTVNEAKLEANKIVGDASSKGQVIITDAEAQARTRAEQIRLAAEQKNASEKVAMQEQLQKETAAMVISGIEKVLKESMTEDMQKSYIQKLKV
jgi:F-type H+-transporting ATPase subunit b